MESKNNNDTNSIVRELHAIFKYLTVKFVSNRSTVDQIEIMSAPQVKTKIPKRFSASIGHAYQFKSTEQPNKRFLANGKQKKTQSNKLRLAAMRFSVAKVANCIFMSITKRLRPQMTLSHSESGTWTQWSF